jgi:hypothetical protein
VVTINNWWLLLWFDGELILYRKEAVLRRLFFSDEWRFLI